MGAEPSGPPSRRWGGAGSGAVFGALTAVATVTAIGRAWAACDIGSSPAANGLTLLLLAPLLWIAAAASWVVLHRTLGRRHRGAALAGWLVLALGCAWFLVTWLGMPDSYPAPSCPDGVPPWWPGFLPA
ncbi:hypothetical protein [Streptomyces sp. NPDC014793]|uniref:hypothetical protein n=1 Tax=Streptomyces sp. NPDC014793 TaxID=3364914 RepID=UPI0036F9150A